MTHFYFVYILNIMRQGTDTSGALTSLNGSCFGSGGTKTSMLIG